MNQKIKISQLPAKGSNLAAQDLIEIAEFTGTGYISKSITGQEIIDAAVGNVDWGDIGGTLSNQTDLQNALDAKQDDITLTTTGSSGASTLVGSTLNVPNYTLSGLGGVPTSRTLTINGVTQDLSADRTFTISTGITIGSTAIASGVVGRVLFEGAGNVVQESSSLFWDNTNGRLGIGTSTAPSGSVYIDNSGNDVKQHLVLKNSDAGSGAQIHIDLHNNVAGSSYSSGASLFFCSSTHAAPYAAALGFWNYLNGPIALATNSAERMRVASTGNVLINTTTDAGFRLDVNGTARVQGALTLSAASPSITLGGDLTITSTLYPSRVASFDILNSNLNLVAGGFGEGMFIGNRLTGSRTSTTFVSPDGLNAVGSAYISPYLSTNGNVIIRASNNGNRSIQMTGLGASGAVLIGNITTGNGTNYSAILQADSTTQGFLPPRMTTTQKNAIASPPAGLMVYDTTLNVISYYNGTMWI